MTITINPFVLGIIVTITSEILALIILMIVIAVKESKRKTNRNKSN